MLANLLEKFKRVDNSVTNNYSDKESEIILNAQEENSVYSDEGDIILVDLGLLQSPVRPGQLVEAYVQKRTCNDLQIVYKSSLSRQNHTVWVPNWVVTSNLGDKHWSDVTKKLHGLEVKPKPERLPLVTGSFVIEDEEEGEFQLVEIDKVNGVYFMHRIDESVAEIIEPNHEHILHTFSKPEDGKYILDPGMYIDSEMSLIEVVPFQGKCWYRYINESEITELDNEYALKLNRIETDDDGMDYYLVGELPDDPGHPGECGEPGCCGNKETAPMTEIGQEQTVSAG